MGIEELLRPVKSVIESSDEAILNLYSRYAVKRSDENLKQDLRVLLATSTFLYPAAKEYIDDFVADCNAKKNSLARSSFFEEQKHYAKQLRLPTMFAGACGGYLGALSFFKGDVVDGIMCSAASLAVMSMVSIYYLTDSKRPVQKNDC